MPIIDPTDLGVHSWYHTTDTAFDSFSHGQLVGSWPNRGTDGTAATEALDANRPQVNLNVLNGLRSILFSDGKRLVATFAGSIAQPFEIYALVRPAPALLSGTRTVLDGIAAGNRARIGWTGVATGRARAAMDGGTEALSPEDRRMFDGPQVMHARFDGASSQYRISSALYFTADAGAHTMTGITIGMRHDLAQSFGGHVFEIIITAPLSVADRRDLYDYLAAKWTVPRFSKAPKNVLLVSGASGDGPSTFAEFALLKRGHYITTVTSANFAATDLSPYDGIVYYGDYNDRVANAVPLRGRIDNGVPVWCSQRERNATGSPTDAMVQKLRCMSQITIFAGFAWGNATITDGTHEITSFLGPVSYAHGGFGGWSSGARHASGTFVGADLIDRSGPDAVVAIEIGTQDLDGVDLEARIVLSGIDYGDDGYYWSVNGERIFQNEVDWLLGTLDPAPGTPPTLSTLQFIEPKYGEILDQSVGPITFTVNDRPGFTGTLQIATAPGEPWQTVAGPGIVGGTTTADLSQFIDGIDYLARWLWSDGASYIHFGFKLITGGPGTAHAYIPFTNVADPNAGTAHNTLRWADPANWWGPHQLAGFAAQVGGHNSQAITSPPNLPAGEGYDVTAYVRFGSLGSPYLGQSTLYWAAEGAVGGVAIFAAGTNTNATGVSLAVRTGTIFPLPPCPGEGRTGGIGITLLLNVRATPGPAPGSSGLYEQSLAVDQYYWAFPSPCVSLHVLPVRLRLERPDPNNPSQVRIRAGLAGWQGSSYWLLDVTETFPLGMGGRVGWSLGKALGAALSLGFRDAYTLGVTVFGPTGKNPFPTPGEPSKPCVLQLDVYDSDGTSLAWRATTDLADPTLVKLLLEPDEYGEQEVDFIEGRASITQVNTAVVDYPTVPGDQDSGIITERLADTLGRGNLLGRRCRLRRFISPTQGWITINDGPAGPPHLMESYSAVGFEIRDTREKERKTRAFPRGETTSLMPRGVLRQGVGPIALGTTIPNVEESPLTAIYRETHPFIGQGYFDLQAVYWSGPTAITDVRMVLLKAAEEAAVGRVFSQITVGGVPWAFYDFPNCVVWWRPLGSGTTGWVQFHPILVDFFSTGTATRNLFGPITITYQGEEVRAARQIQALPTTAGWVVGSGPAPRGLPQPNEVVEVLVQYIGETTKDFPFHWSGELGEFITGAYDGEFSTKQRQNFFQFGVMGYDPGTPVPTKVRYDSAAFVPLTEQVVVRVTEPVDDLRAWLESNAYGPSGWAPAFDRDLNISPLHQRRPAGNLLPALTLIDNDVAEAVPGWADGDKIVNIVKYNYDRLFDAPVDDNGIPVGAVDGIVAQPVTIWWVHTDAGIPSVVRTDDFLPSLSESIKIHGERAVEFNTQVFQAAQALGIPFDETQEQGWILAEDRATTLLPRYSHGAPVIGVPVKRDDTWHLRAGDWIRADLSWMPERLTRRRHLRRYAQITAIRDLNCAWRYITAECDIPIGPTSVAAAGFAATGGVFVALASTIAAAGFAADGGTLASSRPTGGTAAAGFAATGGTFVST